MYVCVYACVSVCFFFSPSPHLTHKHRNKAEESGKRQAEEKRRAEQDEMFRQVVGVHESTIESYLENIIASARDQVADDQGV